MVPKCFDAFIAEQLLQPWISDPPWFPPQCVCNAMKPHIRNIITWGTMFKRLIKIYLLSIIYLWLGCTGRLSNKSKECSPVFGKCYTGEGMTLDLWIVINVLSAFQHKTPCSDSNIVVFIQFHSFARWWTLDFTPHTARESSVLKHTVTQRVCFERISTCNLWNAHISNPLRLGQQRVHRSRA